MPPSAKVAATSLLSAPLGRSSQQIQLSLIPFPDPSANPTDKGRAFDYCRQALESNKHKFEFNEFSAFLAQHIPGACNAALHQVSGFGDSLRSAFFDVSNLQGDCFLYSDGTRVSQDEFTLPARERPNDISIISVKVAVDPTAYTPEGTTVTSNPTMHMTYCLRLPQDTVSISTGQTISEVYDTPKAPRRLEEFRNNELNQNDWSEVGLPGGNDVLEDYELDALVHMPRNKRNLLSERSAAMKEQPVATKLFQSPRLARVLTGGGTTVTTYTGNYDFLNDQATFDKTFPTRTFVCLRNETHVSDMNKFIDLCMLEVLFQLIRIDYVGDLSPCLTSSTIGLTTAIRNLKMRATGDTPSPSDLSNPDDLYHAFSAIAVQLNDTPSSWGLTLAHQFHAALPVEYREDIEANDANGYQLPDPATLGTKDKQFDAIRKLRWVAIDAKKRLETLFKQQSAFMLQYMKSTSKKPSGFATSTPAKNVTFSADTISGAESANVGATSSFTSPAETVIRRHTTSDPTAPSGPSKHTRFEHVPAMAAVTVTIGDKAYPVCQSTGFQSAFDITFRGCLGCGMLDHNSFKDCPMKDDPNIRQAFFNNLHAHKPQYRVKYERAMELRKQAYPQQGNGSRTAEQQQQRTAPAASSSNNYQLLYSPLPHTPAASAITAAYTPLSPATLPPMAPYTPQQPLFAQPAQPVMHYHAGGAQGQYAPSPALGSYSVGSVGNSSQQSHTSMTQPFVGNHYDLTTLVANAQQQHNPAPNAPFQTPQQYQTMFQPYGLNPPHYPTTPHSVGPPTSATAPSIYNAQQTHGSNRDSMHHNPQFIPDSSMKGCKKTRFFVQQVKCHSQRSHVPLLPPMPINIDNGFPNLTLNLGSSNSSSTIALTGLFDTCGSLNTGHLPFHLYIASQHPDVVINLRFFNSADPFEPIKLEGAVADPTDYDASKHGLLTAVIQYKTPYKTIRGQPITVSIALGTDVTTNTIFGLPTLSAFEFVVNLKTLSAVSPIVGETFQLTRAAGSLGFPAGAHFDVDDLHRQYEAARVGLIADLTPDNSENTSSAPAPPVGIDDLSQGYLRRSVIDPRYLSKTN